MREATNTGLYRKMCQCADISYADIAIDSYLVQIVFFYSSNQVSQSWKKNSKGKHLYLLDQAVINQWTYPVISFTFLFSDICTRDFHRLSIYTEV